MTGTQRSRFTPLAVFLGTASAVLLWAVAQPVARAQEHPSGHQEHPSANHEKTAEVTQETLAEAIAGYIAKDATLKGGFFVVYDPQDKQAVALTLDKVHKDRLSKVGKGTYFACADFKATDGKMYDLDVFMKESRAGLDVTEISIHKKEGKPRYDWMEENGLWKQKPLVSTEK